MKVKVMLGSLLLFVGIIAAAVVVAGLQRSNQAPDRPAIAGQQNQPPLGDQNQPPREESVSVILPVIAGVLIAGGAALVGIGMGNFRRPKIVPPDSPEAERAATSRPTTT